MKRAILVGLFVLVPFVAFGQWSVDIYHPPDTLPRIFGVDPAASEGFDSLDYLFPAFPMEFIFYFAIDDTISTLWRDIRPPADTIVWRLVGQWRMYTDVSPETVYWDPSTLPISEGQFYFDTLEDMSTKTNMLESDRYVFLPSSPYGTLDTLYIQFIAGAAPPEDTIPPYADNWYPPCGSDSVPVDLDSFCVDIIDALSGVDSSSIRVTFYGTDITMFADITPLPSGNGYHIHYSIPVILPYDSDIAIQITASDSAGNSTMFSCAWHTEPAVVGCTIKGFVYDSLTGDPIAGAAITDDSLLYSGVSDDSGYYEISGVNPGTHIFAAYKEGYTTRIDTIEVEPGDTLITHDFYLLPATSTVTISGTVYDSASDEPIEGAKVYAVWASGSAVDTTDADGEYILSDIPGGEPVMLVASAEGYIPDTTAGVFSSDTTIDFYLAPATVGYTISGQITLEDATDHSGTVVFLVGYDTVSTDADGNFAFTGLEPGDYELGAYHPGYGSFDTVITITDSDVEIVRELPALPSEYAPPSNVEASDTESTEFYAHLIHITWERPGSYSTITYDDGDLTNSYIIPLLGNTLTNIGVLYSSSEPVTLARIEVGYYVDHPGRCAVRMWDGSAPAEDIDVSYSTYITSDYMMVFDFNDEDITLDGDFFVDFSIPLPVDTLYPIADSVFTDEYDANTYVYIPSYSLWSPVADLDSSFSGFVWLVRVYVTDESGRLALLCPDGSLAPVDDPEILASFDAVPVEMPLARATETMDVSWFRIYRSTSPFTSTTDPGVELIDSVDADTYEYWDATVDPETEYYYGVTAVYDEGTESPLSDVDMGMAIDFRPAADILVLDWDNGENLADGGTADEVEFITSEISSFAGSGVSVHISDQDELLQHFDLTNYRWVFIIAGNSSPMPPIMFYSDTANISAFLSSGDGLFMEGANLANFMEAYFSGYLANFGVSFVDDGSPDSNVRTLTAVDPEFFGASEEFTVEYSFGTVADQSVDEIAPVGDGVALFNSQESDPAPAENGTRVVYREGDCKVVFSTIYFGSIIDGTEPPATRSVMIDSILSHLGVPSAGVAEKLAKPKDVALLGNVPNPFNASTEIRFVLPQAGDVKVEVLDVSGKVVRTLFEGNMPAGTHSLIWNGTDAAGKEMPSGVYTCRVIAGDRVVTTKMSLVK